MAFEFLTKEFLIGAGSSLASAAAGIMAFSRFWVSNRAKNANDTQQIDMLDRQERSLDRLERENQQLRAAITERDDQIRKYFEELTFANGKLQIIQEQLNALKEQNERLTEQVRGLTQSNKDLQTEILHMRAAIGGTR